MAIYDNKYQPTYQGITEDQRNSAAAKVPATVRVTQPRVSPPTRSGGFARGLFDVSATAADAVKAVPKGIADGLNRTLVGARNIAREGVGMAPVQPRQFNYRATQDALAAVRAGNTVPQITRPNFANVRSGSATSYGAPATTPTAEPATPAGRTAGSGDPAPAGRGSAPTYRTSDGRTGTLPPGISVRIGPNGIREFSGTGETVANAGGGPGVVRPTPGYGAGPAQGRPVASTFGQSVRTMPNDNVVQVQRPQVSLRGPDAMAEHYASREDRELRNKILSDLDSQRFRLELQALSPGRRGRAANEALSRNAQQQAELAGASERLSAEAVQGRANRANALANTELEQGGADRRASLSDATTREGQQLGYRADMARIGADIVRPQILQDANGNYVSVAGASGQPITGADGQPIQGPVNTRQTGGLEAGDVLKAYSDQLAAIQGGLASAEEKQAAMVALESSALGQRYSQLLGGAQGQRQAPSLDQFLQAARAANPGVSDADLRAYYNSNYGNR